MQFYFIIITHSCMEMYVSTSNESYSKDQIWLIVKLLEKQIFRSGQRLICEVGRTTVIIQR